MTDRFFISGDLVFKRSGVSLYDNLVAGSSWIVDLSNSVFSKEKEIYRRSKYVKTKESVDKQKPASYKFHLEGSVNPYFLLSCFRFYPDTIS